jgi:hypothetical protein
MWVALALYQHIVQQQAHALRSVLEGKLSLNASSYFCVMPYRVTWPGVPRCRACMAVLKALAVVQQCSNHYGDDMVLDSVCTMMVMLRMRSVL